MNVPHLRDNQIKTDMPPLEALTERNSGHISNKRVKNLKIKPG